MQPIERYGVVALLFLVALVVTVALWDDGTGASEGDDVTTATTEETDDPLPARRAERGVPDAPAPRGAHGRRDRASAPLSGLDEASARRPVRELSRDILEQGPETSPAEPSVAASRPLPRRRNPAREPADRGAGVEWSSSRSARGASSAEPRLGAGRPAGVEDPVLDPVAPVVDREPVAPVAVVETAPPVVERAERAASGRAYEVRSGDSLSRIARRELGRERLWVEIARLNGLSEPYIIDEGMTLLLPDASTDDVARPRARVASNPAPRPAPANARTYRVRKGEVLSVIVQRELGTVRRMDEVLALNPDLDPDRIHAGQTIHLPPGGADGDDDDERRSYVARADVDRTDPAERARGRAGASDSPYRVR